jgi:hypothetical protein
VSLNDLNILNLLPLLESLVDGTISEWEKNSGNAPYKVNGNIIHRSFVLVNGIYPPLKICQWNPDASHQFEIKINSMAGVGMERY